MHCFTDKKREVRRKMMTLEKFEEASELVKKVTNPDKAGVQ